MIDSLVFLIIICDFDCFQKKSSKYNNGQWAHDTDEGAGQGEDELMVFCEFFNGKDQIQLYIHT